MKAESIATIITEARPQLFSWLAACGLSGEYKSVRVDKKVLLLGIRYGQQPGKRCCVQNPIVGNACFSVMMVCSVRQTVLVVVAI